VRELVDRHVIALHAPLRADHVVVLEVLAHATQLRDHGDAVALEHLSLSDAGELEQLR